MNDDMANSTEPKGHPQKSPGFLTKLFPRRYIAGLEKKVIELEKDLETISKQSEREHFDFEAYKQENEDLRDKLTSATSELRFACSKIMTLQSKISGMEDMLEHFEIPYIEINNQGLIQKINPQIEDLLGYKKEELIGKHIKEYLVNESSSAFLSLIPTMMSMHYESASHNAILKTSKGNKSMVLRFHYLTDDKGDYMGTAVFFEEKGMFARWKAFWKNEYYEVVPEIADEEYKKERFGHIFANVVVDDVVTLYFDMKNTKELSDDVIDSIIYLSKRTPTPEVYIKNSAENLRDKLIKNGFSKDHFIPSYVEK